MHSSEIIQSNVAFIQCCDSSFTLRDINWFTCVKSVEGEVEIKGTLET